MEREKEVRSCEWEVKYSGERRMDAVRTAEGPRHARHARHARLTRDSGLAAQQHAAAPRCASRPVPRALQQRGRGSAGYSRLGSRKEQLFKSDFAAGQAEDGEAWPRNAPADPT